MELKKGLTQKMDILQLDKKQSSTIRKAWRAMDTNKDGLLTKMELRKLLLSVGFYDEMAVQKLMLFADENGDGMIDMDEFLK